MTAGRIGEQSSHHDASVASRRHTHRSYPAHSKFQHKIRPVLLRMTWDSADGPSKSSPLEVYIRYGPPRCDLGTTQGVSPKGDCVSPMLCKAADHSMPTPADDGNSEQASTFISRSTAETLHLKLTHTDTFHGVLPVPAERANTPPTTGDHALRRITRCIQRMQAVVAAVFAHRTLNPPKN